MVLVRLLALGTICGSFTDGSRHGGEASGKVLADEHRIAACSVSGRDHQ